MDRESSMLNDMSDREKQIPYDLIICVILKKQTQKTPKQAHWYRKQVVDRWGLGGGEWEKLVKAGQKLQISNDKISQSRGCKVQHGDYS